MSTSENGLDDADANAETSDAGDAGDQGKIQRGSVKQSVVDDDADDDQADAGDQSV